MVAGETADGSLSLFGDDALGRVRVLATGEGGAAVAGAVVRLEAEGFSPVWRPRRVLDGSGAGLFEHVPAGPVTVRLEPPFVGPPQVVTVPPGGEVLVTLTVTEWAGEVPVDLTGADGVPYVVDGSGAVVGGISDCRPLCEGGVWGGYPGSAQALLTMSGREAVFGPFTIDGAQVTRRVFVPASGRFARVLDVVRNPGPERPVSLRHRELLLQPLRRAVAGDREQRIVVLARRALAGLLRDGANEVGLVFGGAGAAVTQLHGVQRVTVGSVPRRGRSTTTGTSPFPPRARRSSCSSSSSVRTAPSSRPSGTSPHWPMQRPWPA